MLWFMGWQSDTTELIPTRTQTTQTYVLVSRFMKSCFNHFLNHKVKVAQLCLTLCNPIDYTVHGILQARIQEWVAVPLSWGSSQPRNETQVSRVVGGFFTS